MDERLLKLKAISSNPDKTAPEIDDRLSKLSAISSLKKKDTSESGDTILPSNGEIVETIQTPPPLPTAGSSPQENLAAPQYTETLTPPQLPKYKKPNLRTDVANLDKDVTAKLIEQAAQEPEVEKLAQQAYDFAQAGKPAATRAVADIMEQKFPDYSYPYILKAHQSAVDGDFKGEATHLTQAIQRDPNNPDLYYQRSIAAQKAGMETTATEDADIYLKSVIKAGTHDEQTAFKKAQAYTLKGDTQNAEYQNYVYEGFKSDRQKGIDSDNLIALSNWMGEKFVQTVAPLQIPGEMVIEGVKKVAENLPNLMAPQVTDITEKLPRVASGVISTTFGALMATPAGIAFNSAIAAGQLVGAGQVTEWAMAPVSKLLERYGVDESKLSDPTKLAVEVANFIPFMLAMSSYHKTANKFAKREPFDEADIRNLDEAVAATTPEMVKAIAENMDKFKADREAAAEVSAIQKSNPETATYRIDDKLLPKEEFVAEVKKRKKKGVIKPDVEVVGDPVMESKVAEIIEPTVEIKAEPLKSEPKIKVEPVPAEVVPEQAQPELDDMLKYRDTEISNLKKKEEKARKDGKQEVADTYKGQVDFYENIDIEDFKNHFNKNPKYYTESNIDPFLRYQNRTVNLAGSDFPMINDINEAKDIKSPPPEAAKGEEVVNHINSLPLTHLEGQNMDNLGAKGTFLSTEQGNRYGKGTKATVDIKNPFVIESEKQMFDEAKSRGIKKGMDVKKMRNKLFDALQAEGYDAVLFRETQMQEGELYVMDRENVKLDGIEPVQVEAPGVVEPTKEELTAKHNRLFDAISSYNKSSKNDRKKTGQGRIKELAKQLDYAVGNGFDGKVEVKKDGKVIKKIAIQQSKEAINSHKVVKDYDNGFQTFVEAATNGFESLTGIDLGMQTTELTKAIKDIREGKQSAPANRVLDRLQGMYEQQNGLSIISGSGNAAERRFVSTEELVRQREADKLELTPEQTDQSHQINPELLDIIEREGIDINNIEQYKDNSFIFDPGEYENVKRYLEKENPAAEAGVRNEVPAGTETPSERVGATEPGPLQREAESRIADIDKELEQIVIDRKKESDRVDKKNANIEIPLEVANEGELIGAEQNPLKDKLAGFDKQTSDLTKERQQLVDSMEERIAGDQAQGDLFAEPEGIVNLPSQSKPTVESLQEELAQGKWAGKMAEFGKAMEQAREDNNQYSSSKKQTQDIPISPLPSTGQAKKITDIIKDFYKGLTRRLDYTKSGRRNAGGWYSPSSGAVTSKRANDLVMASHEGGHAIRDTYNIIDKTSTGLDSELKPYWEAKHASKPPKGLTPDQKLEYQREEGFAEWFRIFVSNPQEAMKSKGIYDLYDSKVPDKVKQVVEKYSNDVRTFAGKSGIDMISANVEDVNTKNRVWKAIVDIAKNNDGARTKLMDKAIVALDNNRFMVEKAWRKIHEIKGIEPMLGDKNFMNHFKLLRDIPVKAAKFNEEGLRNSKNEIVNDVVTGERVSIPWIMKPLLGNNLKEIKSFADKTALIGVALRTMEYARKLDAKNQGKALSGIGGGMFSDVKVAEKAIAEYNDLKTSDPAQYDAITEALRRYEVFADNLLRYYVETGRMSEEGYQHIKDNNLFYFAMQRVKETSPGEVVETKAGAGGSVSGRKEALKTVKGGANIIVNPYVSLMELTEKVVTEGDGNRAMLTFVDGLRSDRKMGEGDVEWLAEIGYKVSSQGAGEPTITVFNKGVKEYWRLSPEIYEGLQATDGLSPMVHLFTTPMRIMRKSITNFPTFQVMNRIRDFTTRLQISQGNLSYKDFKDRKGAVENLENLGSAQFGYNPVDKVDYYKFQEKMMKDIAGERKTILAIHPTNIKKLIGNFYQSTLGNTEIQTRAEEYNSIYRKMKSKGLSDYDAQLEAARGARELLDFKEIGSAMKLINALFPFTNARLKGAEAYIKAIKRNPAGTFAKFALFAMVPQLVNSLLINSSDDDTKKRYLQLPNWRRDLFYNIPVPGMDWWITWPKPFESGLVASAVGRVADYYLLDDKKAFKDKYWFFLMTNLSPISPALITGQGALWVTQLASNYDAFRQANIVPPYEADKDIQLRKGTETASEMGQFLQKMSMNKVDARHIDFAIKNQFGYYGDFALRASNIGTENTKTYKFDPSITRLLRKDSPSGSKDVEWVFKFGTKFGMIQKPEFKSLIKKMQVYRAMEDSPSKKEFGRKIVDDATNMRNKYEVLNDEAYQQFIDALKSKP